MKTEDQKMILYTELKLRLGDIQYSIDGRKSTILKFMDTKYTEEHMRIFKKLVDQCSRKDEQEIADQSKLTCPENILNTDIAEVTGIQLQPAVMSDRDKRRFRELA